MVHISTFSYHWDIWVPLKRKMKAKIAQLFFAGVLIIHIHALSPTESWLLSAFPSIAHSFAVLHRWCVMTAWSLGLHHCSSYQSFHSNFASWKKGAFFFFLEETVGSNQNIFQSIRAEVKTHQLFKAILKRVQQLGV